MSAQRVINHLTGDIILKIVVFGMGYVGVSISCLLSQQNEVIAVDIIEDKVVRINRRESLFYDSEAERFFREKQLSLSATMDASNEIPTADFIIIATPTDYDDATNNFDTSSVDSVIEQLDTCKATIVIKSTLPVGYTEQLSIRYPHLNILVSPEFLREGNALYDNLFPSRIVVGVPVNRIDLYDQAKNFATLLAEGAIYDSTDESRSATDIKQMIVGASEAEAIKLFSNTYLALRVSFFNELDTFAELRNLNSEQIVKGVSLDPRIGDYYNNPSFGYGGYCLPKDTQQLLANYADVPQNIIDAIVLANNTRKDFISDQVISRQPKSVGVYRLIMKSDSDNFRQSSVIGVMERLQAQNVPLTVYEPLLDTETDYGFAVTTDLDAFKQESDLIICNRWDDELSDVVEKVYTRDLWHSN